MVMVPKEDYEGNPLENGGLYAAQTAPLSFAVGIQQRCYGRYSG